MRRICTVFPYSYRSFLYFTPETCDIFIDLNLIRFEKFFRLPFMKFIYMLIIAHEFLHFSHLAGISAKPPGLILNLVKLKSQNINELEKSGCESLAIKKKIMKT